MLTINKHWIVRRGGVQVYVSVNIGNGFDNKYIAGELGKMNGGAELKSEMERLFPGFTISSEEPSQSEKWEEFDL